MTTKQTVRRTAQVVERDRAKDLYLSPVKWNARSIFVIGLPCYCLFQMLFLLKWRLTAGPPLSQHFKLEISNKEDFIDEVGSPGGSWGNYLERGFLCAIERIKQGKPKRAFHILKKIERKMEARGMQASSTLCNNIGVSLAEMKKYRAARKRFRKAIDLDRVYKAGGETARKNLEKVRGRQ